MSTLDDLYAAAPSTQILTDGYSLKATNKGYEGTIRFWVLGSDMPAFSVAAAGLAKTITISGVSVTRLIPLLHPRIANCYADDIQIYPPEGDVATLGTDGSIDFADYFADIHFSTPTYQYEEGDYPTTTLNLNGGVDMVTRPGSAYKFPSDGLRINHDVGVPVQTVDFALTMSRLPSVDFALYTSLAGCVNTAEFYGCDPGTVLYQGPGVNGQSTIGGLPSYDVTHQFKFRSIPHNQIMRPDGAGFEAPVEEGDGVTMLLPGQDLNALWGM
jgi:hypothetical protein